MTAVASHDDIVGPFDTKCLSTICGPLQSVDCSDCQDLADRAVTLSEHLFLLKGSCGLV